MEFTFNRQDLKPAHRPDDCRLPVFIQCLKTVFGCQVSDKEHIPTFLEVSCRARKGCYTEQAKISKGKKKKKYSRGHY